MAANGPAIKGVSVPAIGGVARFLPSSCKFFEFYVFRGTRFIGSRSSIPLHRFCWEQWRSHGDVPLYCVLVRAGSPCKNRDKSYNLYCPCYG